MNSNGHNFSNEVGAILTGAVTGVSIGSFIFQALATVVLGALGALGGWLFLEFAQPYLKAKFGKKKNNKA